MLEVKTAFITLSCLLTFISACLEVPAEGAPKIYLIATGDTDDASIGPLVRRDLNLVTGVFRAHVPADQLTVYCSPSDADREENQPVLPAAPWQGCSIRSGDAIHKALLDAIDSCPCDPNDAIVVYWSGHGAYDNQGHYFLSKDPHDVIKWKLTRSEVARRLQAKSTRLAVLLTNSCNKFLDLRHAEPALAAPYLPEPPLTIAPIFYSLFVRHRGFADLNASSEGEFAWGTQDGGLFTQALFGEPVETPVDSEDGPRSAAPEFADQDEHSSVNGTHGTDATDVALRDETVFAGGAILANITRQDYTWYELYRDSSANLSDLFLLASARDSSILREQPKQTVRAWCLPVPLEEANTNTPITEWVRLEPGDIIVEINGQPIHNQSDYWYAVKGSPTTMVFVVESVRGGTLRLRTHLLRRTADSRFGVDAGPHNETGVTVLSVRRGYPGMRCEVIDP